jgi:hypothetical protein
MQMDWDEERDSRRFGMESGFDVDSIINEVMEDEDGSV